MMRLFIIFLVVGLLLTQVRGVSQTITLTANKMPMAKVFAEVKRQTGYVVVSSYALLEKTAPVTIDVQNQPLEVFMKEILKGRGLEFVVEGKTISVREKGGKMKDESAVGKVRGKVVDEGGNALVGTTVRVKGKDVSVVTNERGEFELEAEIGSLLEASYIGFEGKEVKVKGNEFMEIALVVRKMVMDTTEVVVKGSTGYQVIDKKHPGSFDVIDNKLLNRKVSRDILSRIENLTPGISFGNQGGVLIRGRNSIYSNVNPLIVVDNFPYDGDINNINPNDVENITILKDAAAAAQWGAKAGNGVIVITTKRGRTNKPTIEMNNNFSFQDRPDLQRLPVISSSDAVEVEKWLFNKGYYNFIMSNNTTYPVISPVQELLLKKRNNQIDAAEADRLIEQYKTIDARTDLEKYFYQPSIAQQYAFNVSGNTGKISYYLSAGFDKQRLSLVGNHTSRISLRSLNTFSVTKNFAINAGVQYIQNNAVTGGNAGINTRTNGKGLYPYADLVDDNGNSLAIVKEFRNSYTDTAGNGKLLDWKYRPYDEIDNYTNTNRTHDFLLNVGMQYKLWNTLNAEISYQFQNALSLGNGYYRQDAYYVRDLINRYYQPNAINKYPVSFGGILDKGNQESISHQGRFQLSYNKTLPGGHTLSGIGGWEIRNLKSTYSSSRMYGYNEKGSTVNPTMDFVTEFPQYYWPQLAIRVDNPQDVGGSLDRFVSYYINILYSFKERYTFSASARKDEANLFGVNTNQKGTPLWSAGIAWDLSKEKFYSFSWLPQLKLKMSYGHSGNLSRTASAITTIERNIGAGFLGQEYASISNFPNQNLRWEQNRIFNLGIDFETRKRRLNGSFQVYRKHNVDLLAQNPIDPSTGLTPINGGRAYFWGNVASVKGTGYELSINSLNVNRAIQWNTSFQFTNVLMKVAEYFIPAPLASSQYIGMEGSILPIIGQPIYTFYAYKWGGLDPVTGDPMGYLDGKKSKDYTAIFERTPVDSLVYKGNADAPVYGAVLNSISWKNFTLSLNVAYRFKYNIRKSTLSYQGLYSSWTGHSDYAKRWQKPGDELSTNVPSQVYTNYPNFVNRGNFYNRSEIAIIEGDHIKIEDFSIEYLLSGKKKKMPFKQLRVYGYINNINIVLWKANKEEVDSIFPPNGRINRPNIAIGVSATF